MSLRFSKMSIKVLIGNKLFETNAFSSRGWAVSQIEVPDVGIIEIIFRLLRFLGNSTQSLCTFCCCDNLATVTALWREWCKQAIRPRLGFGFQANNAWENNYIYTHTMYTYIHNSRHNSYTKRSGFSVSGVGRAQRQSDELRTGLPMFPVTSPEKHRLLIALKLTFAFLANYMIHFLSYCEIWFNTSS